MIIPYLYLRTSQLLISFKGKDVAEFNRQLSKYKSRNLQMKHANERYRQSLKAKTLHHIDSTWPLFPLDGLDKAKVHCLCNPLINYGLHQLSLGFDLLDEEGENNQNRIAGTRSLGLRYENEHTVRSYNREMCPYSEKHIEFLKHIHSSIYFAFPAMRKVSDQFMRVNLVVGAKTGSHTDTMRGATPNFMLIEPDSAFQLAVRQFPKFKCQVVECKGQLKDYHGKLFIPHEQKRHWLIMIGSNEMGFPWCYQFPTEAIEDLAPMGEIDQLTVVGIKEKKLQMLPWKYSVQQTTKNLTLMNWGDVVDLARKHPSKMPTVKCCYYDKPGKWHMFYGWMNSHRWVQGTDHRGKRIHVFYRPVREETPSARTRNRNDTEEPMTYTVVK